MRLSIKQVNLVKALIAQIRDQDKTIVGQKRLDLLEDLLRYEFNDLEAYQNWDSSLDKDMDLDKKKEA